MMNEFIITIGNSSMILLLYIATNIDTEASMSTTKPESIFEIDVDKNPIRYIFTTSLFENNPIFDTELCQITAFKAAITYEN